MICDSSVLVSNISVIYQILSLIENCQFFYECISSIIQFNLK